MASDLVALQLILQYWTTKFPGWVRTFRSKLFLLGSKLWAHDLFSRTFWGFPPVLYHALGRKTKYSRKHLLLLPNLLH